MGEPLSELEEMLGLEQMLQFAAPLSELKLDDRALARQMVNYDAVLTASLFGALLTVPELQCNCARLEFLAHQTLALGKGSRRPSAAWIARNFKLSGAGRAGRLEDPAEDVFVTNISTNQGNFRVLEGIWESGGFYLQRFIDIIDAMPSKGQFLNLKDSVFALLRLSDAICERAGLSRYQLGSASPADELSDEILGNLEHISQRVRFSDADLARLGIAKSALEPFFLRPASRRGLLHESLGHSSLERYPLASRNGNLFALLPTAVSATIRRFVIEFVEYVGQREILIEAIAASYSSLFWQTNLCGGARGAEFQFQMTGAWAFAGATFRADLGRYLNLVLVLDTLEDFERTGLTGSNPDPNQHSDAIDEWIDHARHQAMAQPGFVDGITLIVGCGVGRAALHYLNKVDRPDWRVEFIAAADLFTLSWVPKFKPLSLWRILDGQEAVRKSGVALQNVNGLLNLVAWSRSLGGHLVPHATLPDDFVTEGYASLIAIPTNAICALRHEVAAGYDAHVELDVEGVWRRVRRASADNLFAEDRERPDYVCEEPRQKRGVLGLHLTRHRGWWCDSATPDNLPGAAAYEYWQVGMTWISRAANTLESAFPQLPNGPIFIEFHFPNAAEMMEASSRRLPFEEARAGLSVEVNQAARTVRVTSDERFERANMNPENVAEQALVGALIFGVGLYAGVSVSPQRERALIDEIVPNTRARHRHAFHQREFRDFVRISDRRPVVFPDQDDDAMLSIGLGWRIRDRHDGNTIHGVLECTDYLNRLVKLLEDELCRDLGEFNRAVTIRRLLHNYETAAYDAERWRRTSGAVLALRRDQDQVRQELTNHQNEINSVTQTTRLLIELALTECPLGGGRTPGDLELSRLMAKAGALFGYGGWSEAIRWGAIEPTLRITALGDVQANLQLIDQVLRPFARAFNDNKVDSAISEYDRRLEPLTPIKTVGDRFGDEFGRALVKEIGASIDEYRLFVDSMEDAGIKAGLEVLQFPKSEVIRIAIAAGLDAEVVERVVEQLLLRPRSSRSEVPPGYNFRDIQFWRNRRRLSVLRKPLLQIDLSHDPIILVAPGLLREGVAYTLESLHRGAFPDWQLSKAMRSWQGRVADERGRAFAETLASDLREAGWKAETEIKITKLFNRSFERDYGDVDVLAWHELDRRVLVVECKYVQFKKSLGEVAEQLREFRGEYINGRPDYLRRHLDRIDLITRHLNDLATYIGWPSVDGVESHLAFRHQVPMQFALQRLEQQVRVSAGSDLARQIIGHRS